MCIARKQAIKKKASDVPAKTDRNTKVFPKKPPEKKKREKPAAPTVIPKKPASPVSIIDLTAQFKEEKRFDDGKQVTVDDQPEVEVIRPKLEKINRKVGKPSGVHVEKKKSKKMEKQMERKEEEKREVPKKSRTEKTPSDRNSGNLAKKKTISKFKCGQVDRDEISINNDKTEFLENAQLTKLMSHADVKALMGGQLAQGAENDENSCRDTVEEVDSDMEDIAFSPLLVGIIREEEKAYGVLPNPHE